MNQPSEVIRAKLSRSGGGKDGNDLRSLGVLKDAVNQAVNEARTEAQKNNDSIPTKQALIPSSEEIVAAKLTPRCIVSEYLYADVAQIVAPGSTGKTTQLLYECACIALGRQLWGFEVVSPGWTLFVTAEDQRERLIARLRSITDAMELDATERRHVFESVLFWDVTGTGQKLVRAAEGNIILSGLADAVVDRFKDDPPVIVTFDPLVSFGASEQAVNDNEQALITAARRIVRGLGCCVRYVHHTGKGNARAGTLDQYSGRGGSALADGTRMTTVLQKWRPGEDAGLRPPSGCRPDPDAIITVLARAKLSYAPPNLPRIWIRRTGFAFEYFTELAQCPEQAASGRADQLERFLISQLKLARYWTKRNLEDRALDDLGMSRDQMRRAVSELEVSGRVVDAGLPEDQRQGRRRTYLHPTAGTAATDTEGHAPEGAHAAPEAMLARMHPEEGARLRQACTPGDGL